MTIEEYRKQTPLTNVELGHKLNLAHMVIGMCSEFDELEDAINHRDKINTKEEMGDIMWYTGNISNMLNIQTPEIDNERLQYFPVQKNVFKLCNEIKRYIAYGKEIDNEKVTILVNKIIQGIAFQANQYQIAFPDILTRNIEKLRARFPNGFTQYDSLNRNLPLERNILEKE